MIIVITWGLLGASVGAQGSSSTACEAHGEAAVYVILAATALQSLKQEIRGRDCTGGVWTEGRHEGKEEPPCSLSNNSSI